MSGVKWNRAVHHVEALAKVCADMSAKPDSIFPLKVTALWVAGDVLGPERDLDTILVALVVDLPVEDVPWLTEPGGSRHWGNAVRLPQLPFRVCWRSAHAPVWNHLLDRPALVWTAENGTDQHVLDALADARGDDVRAAAPEDVASRLAADLAVSHRALTARTATYADRRWRPGKLEPVADALWQASEGYLDLLAATAE
jgi:hypothetical protein